MIAFGCAISESEPYRRYVAPGLRRAAEPDSEVYAFACVESIHRSYNLLLDAASKHPDLEALVLLHPHVEILDAGFCAKVREALTDEDVAIVGCAGATGVRGIAWWEGAVVAAPVIHRYHEHGGGELPAFSWTGVRPPSAAVDSVDGLLLVLSPWAVRTLRFDESLALGDGFDLDFCLQARAAGRKVVVADLRVAHHHSLELVEDLDLWVEAHVRIAEKWDGQMPGVSPGADCGDEAWKQRARRAEAEREAARAVAYGYALGIDARVLELERAMAEATSTVSWRVTAPLRRLNHLRSLTAGRMRGRCRP